MDKLNCNLKTVNLLMVKSYIIQNLVKITILLSVKMGQQYNLDTMETSSIKVRSDGSFWHRQNITRPLKQIESKKTNIVEPFSDYFTKTFYL